MTVINIFHKVSNLARKKKFKLSLNIVGLPIQTCMAIGIY